MREAAVYVIVLMLPLAFAAFVWPARRVWALRSLEVLMALILSKFAIVAVLSLGGAALGHGVHKGLAAVLAGLVLLILGAFTPWALLRLLPLAEMASGTAGALRGHSGTALRSLQQADGWATQADRWAARIAHMRRTAGASNSSPAPPPRAPLSPNASAGSTAFPEVPSPNGAPHEPSPPDPPDEADPRPPGRWIYPGNNALELSPEGLRQASD